MAFLLLLIISVYDLDHTHCLFWETFLISSVFLMFSILISCKYFACVTARRRANFPHVGAFSEMMGAPVWHFALLMPRVSPFRCRAAHFYILRLFVLKGLVPTHEHMV